MDFPRLPLTSDKKLFAALVKKGAELVDLHLLRQPGKNLVGGEGGSSLLSLPGRQGISFPSAGSNIVEHVHYVPPQDSQTGRVYLNETQYFAGVDEATWDTILGGYQPLERWLKERRGQVLTVDDVRHYMQMIIALRETNRIMNEIDQLIPSWPLS